MKVLNVLCLGFFLFFCGSCLAKNKIVDWNFIVYIVSNNDLEPFAAQNINEMIQIGSNKNVNILIQVDTHKKNESCRYFIKKNEPVLMDVQTNNDVSTSGTPRNLFNFAKWAITNFPSKHQALVLWDHGSGIEDPCIFGRVMVNYPHDFFMLNKKTGLFELNKKLSENKGIGFNEVFQTYLTNQDLAATIKGISEELLGGKKIEILGMDACFMAMLEICVEVCENVEYLVASQEVEPGSGWKYNKLLEVFNGKTLTPEEFSKHIVKSYKQNYQHTHTDYTLSAIDLKNISLLKGKIDSISSLLLAMAKKDKNVMKAIDLIRSSSNLTTSFTNRSYIDLLHFLRGLADIFIVIEETMQDKTSFEIFMKLLTEGIELANSTLLKSVTCHKLSTANGLSIYFPNYSIHSSYYKTEFATNNSWKDFLEEYLHFKASIFKSSS